jgi:hypothetical protein
LLPYVFMIKRLTPLFFCAAVLAEAPRPSPGFEGVNVRFTSGFASGSSDAQEESNGFEVTGNFPMTQVGTWNYDWGFRYEQSRHDWTNAPVDFDLVRGVSLSLSGYVSTEGVRKRYAVLQVNADAAEHASLSGAVTVQGLYGADWKLSEEWTVGYLFLAETRAVSSPTVLVVPTFRWKFAPNWSLGTGRKSLVLDYKIDDVWKTSLAVTFLQEEARLADVGGQRRDFESERVAAILGFKRQTPGRVDEINLGWAFNAKARTELGGVESKFDLAPGALISLSSRWKF